MSGKKQKHKVTKQKSSRWKKILVRALCVVAAMIIILLLLRACGHRPGPAGERDADALQGSLSQMSEQEIQAELDRIVEEGMFRISIASTILVNEDGQAELRIENNQTNRYIMQVDIVLDATGETIYVTELIDPGHYIEKAAMHKRLEPGEHLATAVFTALDTESEQPVGTVRAQVRIIVA